MLPAGHREVFTLNCSKDPQGVHQGAEQVESIPALSPRKDCGNRPAGYLTEPLGAVDGSGHRL